MDFFRAIWKKSLSYSPDGTIRCFVVKIDLLKVWKSRTIFLSKLVLQMRLVRFSKINAFMAAVSAAVVIFTCSRERNIAFLGTTLFYTLQIVARMWLCKIWMTYLSRFSTLDDLFAHSSAPSLKVLAVSGDRDNWTIWWISWHIFFHPFFLTCERRGKEIEK